MTTALAVYINQQKWQRSIKHVFGNTDCTCVWVCDSRLSEDTDSLSSSSSMWSSVSPAVDDEESPRRLFIGTRSLTSSSDTALSMAASDSAARCFRTASNGSTDNATLGAKLRSYLQPRPTTSPVSPICHDLLHAGTDHLFYRPIRLRKNTPFDFWLSKNN